MRRSRSEIRKGSRRGQLRTPWASCWLLSQSWLKTAVVRTERTTVSSRAAGCCHSLGSRPPWFGLRGQPLGSRPPWFGLRGQPSVLELLAAVTVLAQDRRGSDWRGNRQFSSCWLLSQSWLKTAVVRTERTTVSSRAAGCCHSLGSRPPWFGLRGQPSVLELLAAVTVLAQDRRGSD
ncbi:hypothetical protein RRG08_000051 [Elysia crispata]|uniref:Uncharacterized protein n=1 Tax=Elysia crispata TaxID=231223 RepID=A0AAE0Y611_9GAST|nr:hypothetical protein RRG08_000051 [Elysia crispata]